MRDAEIRLLKGLLFVRGAEILWRQHRLHRLRRRLLPHRLLRPHRLLLSTRHLRRNIRSLLHNILRLRRSRPRRPIRRHPRGSPL